MLPGWFHELFTQVMSRKEFLDATNCLVSKTTGRLENDHRLGLINYRESSMVFLCHSLTEKLTATSSRRYCFIMLIVKAPQNKYSCLSYFNEYTK